MSRCLKDVRCIEFIVSKSPEDNYQRVHLRSQLYNKVA